MCKKLKTMLVSDSVIGEHESLKRDLENLLKLMLVVWCKENNAIKIVTGNTSNGSNKIITIERKSGEYGFRIHGSKPVIISAIESDTPAENSGLEIGDVVVSINEINVLDKSHAEVVKITQMHPNTINLEIAHTNKILNPVTIDVCKSEPICNGYLWKLGGHASGTPSTKWVRRWFVLKADSCLYYYKTDSDNQPVGAILLLNYKTQQVEDLNEESPVREYRFNLIKQHLPTLHLAADSNQALIRWVDVLNEAIDKLTREDVRLDKVKHNLVSSPNSLENPDCFGYLDKLSHKTKTYKRRYCVLKDAFLYLYDDVLANNALGVAHIDGNTIKFLNEAFKFEINTNDITGRSLKFKAESDMDYKRWIEALRKSITLQ